MTKPGEFRIVPPAVIRSTIAHAVIGPRRADANRSASASIGDVLLMPHQRDAVQRLRSILRTMHVALLADDVGLGKTYVALAIAREYCTVRVLAPAALIPMWRNAIARTTSHHVAVESLQRYSRVSGCAPFQPNTLVIIDEAHHLRTPTTKRYAAIAQGVTGCDVLLLSATPVHNSPRDLRALLGLVLGGGAARLSRALLATVIVRRTDAASRPRVVAHPPVTIPHDPALLNGILSIPAPLPAHDGAVAGALIRLGLLRAWCSSDAALSSALRRRLLRGEALRHALEAGRHPTSAELRTWLVGEHEVQLAFPELSATHATETGPLLEILNRHLDAVHTLLRAHRSGTHSDSVRADALRAILATHPRQPVVAFSQFAETIRAISRALADIAGVGALTGNRAWIASGRISREEALAAFAPIAQGKPPPAEHQRITLLLTTDLLAEGVNLQDAGIVVHLDLPWTDALRRQRVGRCVRVGSAHTEVSVYQFEPHTGAARVLGIVRRLERKARITTRLVGAHRLPDTAPRRRNARPSAADAATQLQSLLCAWNADAATQPILDETVPAFEHTVRDAVESHATGIMLTYVPADRAGFIVLLRCASPSIDGSEPIGHGQSPPATVLAGSFSASANGRLRVHIARSPERVHDALLYLHPDAGGTGSDSACRPIKTPSERSVRVDAHQVHRAVLRWIARQALAADLDEPVVATSSVHRHARALLDHTLGGLTTSQRIASRLQFQRAYRMIEQAHGAGAERAIVEWMANRRKERALDWLEAWRDSAVLRVANHSREDGARPVHEWRLHALVILTPLV